MKRPCLLLCSLALALLSPHSLFADTFNFSFTGNDSVTGIPGTPFSGSGQFTTIATSTANQFQIIGVTGTTNNRTISNVLAPGSYGFNDNLLFYTSGAAFASLDNAGVSYLLSNGINVNVFLGFPSQYQQTLFGFGEGLVVEAQTADVRITPQASAVPEPGTLTLMATGAFGVATSLRRRFAA